MNGIQRQRHAFALEHEVFALLAEGASSTRVLDALVVGLERACSSGSIASLLLLDPLRGVLRHGAAPSLPAEYNAAIDGERIGPSVGSCGTAAFRGERVVVSDIETDPLWADFRALARAHGLRACWSEPIRSREGRVLGTISGCYAHVRSILIRERGREQQEPGADETCEREREQDEEPCGEPNRTFIRLAVAREVRAFRPSRAPAPCVARVAS